MKKSFFFSSLINEYLISNWINILFSFFFDGTSVILIDFYVRFVFFCLFFIFNYFCFVLFWFCSSKFWKWWKKLVILLKCWPNELMAEFEKVETLKSRKRPNYRKPQGTLFFVFSQKVLECIWWLLLIYSGIWRLEINTIWDIKRGRKIDIMVLLGIITQKSYTHFFRSQKFFQSIFLSNFCPEFSIYSL